MNKGRPQKVAHLRLRIALQKIRLHGSLWWKDEWGSPTDIANAALLADDEFLIHEAAEWDKAAKATGT